MLADWTWPQEYSSLSTPQTASKMVRNSDPRRYNNLSVSARRSVELDDDKVVSEYEED